MKVIFNEIRTVNIFYSVLVLTVIGAIFLFDFIIHSNTFFARIAHFSSNIFVFIIPAIIIEILCNKKKLYTIGMNFDRFTVRDFTLGAIFGLSGIAFIAIFANICGGNFILAEINSPQKILEATIWIFNDATVEELLFRGFLLQNIYRKNNSFLILIISSLLFSFVHFANNSFNFILFINIFLAGILLCLMYVQTKSLWLSISFHCFWNWAQNIFFTRIFDINYALNLSDKTSFYFIYFDELTVVNRLLFGDSSGFEAGLICSFLLIFFIFITVKAIKPSYLINAYWLKNNS